MRFFIIDFCAYSLGTSCNFMQGHQPWWYNGWNLCLIFDKSWVRISAQRPTKLTEIIRGFLQSHMANAGTGPYHSVVFKLGSG
jgi:hypothetical protein